MSAADPPFLSVAALLTHSVAVGTRLPAPVVGCAVEPGAEEKAAAGTPPASPPRSRYRASSAAASAAPRAKRKAAQAGTPAHPPSPRKWSGKSCGDHAWYLAAEDTLAAGHPLDPRSAARHAALASAFDAERVAWWAAAWAGAAAGWRGQGARAPQAVAAAHAASHAASVDARVRTLPPLWTCTTHVSLTAAMHAAAAVPGAPPPPRPLRGPARLPPLTLPRPGATLDVAPPAGLTAGLAPPLPRDAAARELAAREGAAAVATGGALARLAGAGLAPPGGADPGWVLPLALEAGVLYVDAPLPDAGGGDVRSACARAAKKALVLHGARPCPRSPYYSAWTVPDGGAGATIIVRTHVHGASGGAPGVRGGDAAPVPTTIIARSELRGPSPADAEEPHPAAAAAAAVTAALRPGAAVVVAHVGGGGRVLRYSSAPRGGGAALARPLALLAAARAAAVSSGDGRYLWVRAPGADASALLRAGGGEGTERRPLPLASPLSVGQTTDLHAAYAGPPPALAPAPPAPAAWRPAAGGVAQVPHTWPPRGSGSGGKKNGAATTKRRAGLPPPAARRGVASRPDLDAPRGGGVAGAGAAFAAGAGEGL